MASLFISYSRKDIEIARQLTDAFTHRDLDFWIDWRGIPPSVDWWREIEKGIEETDVFLFLLSPESTNSKICKREVEHAVKNGKRLIPIVVRDISASEAPAELRALNWIWLRPEDPFRSGFSQLLQTIKTDYAWVQTHRQLQVKALEWERSSYKRDFLLRGEELQDAESQLVTNSSKEPPPTDLQRRYVLMSRQASDRQRRRTMGLTIAAVIALAGLAIFGFVQAKLATDRANVALARQLAAQAQSMMAIGDSGQTTAVLLAIQSMRLVPFVEAAQVLQDNTLPYEVSRMTISLDRINDVAVSPNGKYAVSSGYDQTVRVWDIATGNEVIRMTHDGPVGSVAFSPDGKRVVSASDDKTVRVWDISTGEEVLRMGHLNEVETVGFSPDGKYIVSIEDLLSVGGVIHVWDATTGTEAARLVHDGQVDAVAFDADGQHAVSASGKTVRVWDLATGRETARITLDAEVGFVDVSPDGKYVISGSWDSTARVWEIATGREIARMTHTEEIPLVAFSPDGVHVLSASCDKIVMLQGFFCTYATVRVWEATTGKEIARVVHKNRITSIAISPDGKYAASGSQDGIAMVWEVATGKEIARMAHDGSIAFSPNGEYIFSTGSSYSNQSRDVHVWEVSTNKNVTHLVHGGGVSSVAISPDGKYVASGGGDNTARVWDVATGAEIARMTHDKQVNSVAFSPDGKYVASGSDDGTARVWEAMTGAEIARITHNNPVNSVAFSPDSKYVVSGGWDSTIRLWVAATGEEIVRMDSNEEVSSVSFSKDGRYLASAGCDMVGITIGSNCLPGEGTARVWKVSTGEELARITYDIAVFAVAFSPDGKYVVSASWDGTARVWEAATGKEATRMTYNEGVSAVAFSPDGKYVVSGGCDSFGYIVCTQGTARVWEAQTGKEVARLTDDEGVSAVAFSPDGKYIVSSGCDKVAHRMGGPCSQAAVRVWEALTGKEIARTNHEEYVSSVAFSPDGKYVVSGSSDGTVHIWRYPADDLIGEACSRLSRNLTRAEWAQYIGDALPYPTRQEDALCPNLPLEREAMPTLTATP